MKASQVLKVDIEGIVNLVRFDALSPDLHPLVAKLEKDGDLYGPACLVITTKSGVSLCVSISYADKGRGPVKPTIFGYDSDSFLAKQYKA